ncbi:MoxR family ATPase [Ammoniphilus sp. YIM 78166]|uniref:AAA family ATPase n=1 Tax=Ammoniphilus sp. YIM 78166 TaxID=1644106 RepID=UPI001F107DDF|nr:MoxR family ATPase [Ammoniphilus sp. YIM 78166]
MKGFTLLDTTIAPLLEKVTTELSKVVIGRRHETKLLLTALLSKGHILLEDLPGTGKTTLVKAFAKVLDCSFSRIQCTPDLLPSDVLGMSIYNPKTAEFTFRTGPIFNQILLVDEINRALPRTQSSLLEGMEEHQVTIEGETRSLQQPFLVMATQNPIEMEGTFPLPEAQMDRFLMRIKLGYPSREEEEAMLKKVGDSLPFHALAPILTPASILSLQEEATKVFVHDEVIEYLVLLAQETRHHPLVSVGVSPRGSKALYKALKAWALLAGRNHVLPDDVKELVPYIWAHRMELTMEASVSGKEPQAILHEILEKTPIPLQATGKTL